MPRTLARYSRENKDVVLDLWKRMAPEYWNHKMIAAEVGMSHAAVSKLIRRARAAGDKRAVYPLVGKAPWNV